MANDAGKVEKLPEPISISHKEGDIISIVFVDAKEPTINLNQERIGKEHRTKYVKQILIAVLVPEEGQDNSIKSNMAGLVNLKSLRDSESDIYFIKLKKHSEL